MRIKRLYVEVKDEQLTEVVEAAREARSTFSHGLGCPAFMSAGNARHCTCGVSRLLTALDVVQNGKVV